MRLFLIPLCLCAVIALQAQEAVLDRGVANVSGPRQPNALATVRETIVVTATRSERAVSELPVSTSVLSEERIESAPAITVDDLLRTIPGVHIPLLGSTAHPAAASRVSMHGLGGTRALVLLDGIPIHDPYYGTVQWQKVPLDTLRQVEVVRGGSAGMFGNYALGGTINLLTRPVAGNMVRAEAAYGSLNTQRQGLTVDHMLSRSVGVRLSHSRFDTDGFQLLVEPGPLDRPAWSDSAVTGARVDYAPSPSTQAFLKANWSEWNVTNGFPFGDSFRDFFDVSAGLQRPFGNASLLSARAFHQSEEMLDNDGTALAGNTGAYLSSHSVVPSGVSGASAEWSVQRSGVLPYFTFGVDYTQNEVEDTAYTLSQTGVTTSERIASGNQRFAGVYGQASWQPSARLEFLGTVRVDHFRNSDGREVTVGGETIVHPDKTETEIDPRISFRYSLAPRMVVRGAAYRAFKAPSLRELYRTVRSRRSTTLPNPLLEPEKLVGAELGMEWAFDRGHVGLNVYRSDVQNLLARVIVSTGVNQNQNLGEIRSQGVELMGDFTLSKHWSVEASYTYADSTIVEDPDPTLEGNLVPDVAPHIGTASLRYRSDGGTLVDLRGRVVSTSYGEPSNAVPQTAHRVFDVMLSHPLRSWLDAYVIAENVMDEEYFYVTSTTKRATRPRTITGGVRLRIPTSRRSGS